MLVEEVVGDGDEPLVPAIPGTALLSPPIRRMATLRGSNAKRIRIVGVGRSSLMFGCRDW
jgi:hypothetical protein